MFTTLAAVLVALALGHVAPAAAASLRSVSWFQAWLHWLSTGSAGRSRLWQGRYGSVLAILPAVMVVGLVQWGLSGHLAGFGSLLFGILVLAACWGPRDLDRDVEAVIDADDTHARHAAISQLQSAGGSLGHDVSSLVEATMVDALRRWFAPLLWFLLLGPVGAVLYRLLALLAQSPQQAQLPERALEGARWALALLEWPVAQLMVLSMALVGNFDTVSAAWRDASGGRWSLQAAFLAAAARASVSAELREEAHDYTDAGMVPVWRRLPELRDAMSLVWRMLLLWLVVLALLILAGWVS